MATYTPPVQKTRPDNPRQSMKPSDLGPDDARAFVDAIQIGMRERVRSMPDSKFTHPDGRPPAYSEMCKQHYGNNVYQLFAGIVAALDQWDESGRDIQELKDKYGGKFVEGVEIGERLAVYEGRDFTFVQETDDNSDKSKFTFVK